MAFLLLAGCAAAFAYQILALAACLRHLAQRDPPPARTPPVSVLKPVHGRDPGFAEAIRSHAAQDYPAYEILFGVSDPADPAAADIDDLRTGFPHLPIRLILSRTNTENGKVGVLADLAAEARHPILLVNDSDIHVPPGYLRSVTAPLEDPAVGLVTCLYRATAGTLPGKWEALGIATDFTPGALVAPLFGVREFGLGSTLVFRARDLERIGGFHAIADFLADDYQLARRITGLGLRAHMSRTVVRTHLQAESWRDVWRHQLRWHRTIRVSRGAYAGLPLSNASLWALAALLSGAAWAAAGLLAARMTLALVAGLGVLRCPVTARWFWLVPLRDLSGLAVWAAGLFGRTVRWRGQRLRLSPDGRIRRLPGEPTR